MKKISAELDTLKEIILLYANTPPDTIENLRLIEKKLLDPDFLDGDGQSQIWEGTLSQTELNIRIETIIKIHAVGLARAKAIFDDPKSKDVFISDIYGYLESYPPDIERRREIYDSAFCDVYKYGVKCRTQSIGGKSTMQSICPCSFAKKKLLQEAGYLIDDPDFETLFGEAGHRMHAVEGGFINSPWLKKRVNCLQCDHLHFVTILKNISKGCFDHLSESEIVANYSKTSIEGAFFRNAKQPIGKRTEYEYMENKAAFPKYLKGLPCNILVDLLWSGPYAKNIKRCPICETFFFAKDSKRQICYDDSCFKEYERKKKRLQREVDPVKYV